MYLSCRSPPPGTLAETVLDPPGRDPSLPTPPPKKDPRAGAKEKGLRLQQHRHDDDKTHTSTGWDFILREYAKRGGSVV